MTGKTKVIGVRFPVEDLALIKAQADLHKVDVSTYIRTTVLSHIDEIKRISSSSNPCEALYEVKESLYKLILDLKLNKRCQGGGENIGIKPESNNRP